MNVKLKLREKIGYSAGEFTLLLCDVQNYLMLFMTSMLGISAMAAGTILAVGSIWDAINDPMMGFLADRTRTKIGSYRPYILIGGVLVVTFSVLCFTNPGFSSMGGKIAWATFAFIGYGMTKTVMGMPLGAMLNHMTTDLDERRSLGNFRSMGTAISGIVISLVSVRMLIAVSGDPVVYTEKAYFSLAMLWAVIGLAAAVFCFASCKERVPAAKTKFSFKETIKPLKGNKPALCILIMSFCIIFSAAFRSAGGVYFYLSYVGDMTIFANVLFTGSVVQLIFLVGIAKYVNKLSVRTSMFMGAASVACSGVSIFLSKVIGIPAYYLANVFFGLAMGLVFPAIYSTLGNIADYGEWKTGVHVPAFMFTLSSFCQKFGGSMASQAIGVILTVIAYNTMGNPLDQSASTLNGLFLFYALIPIVVGAIMFIATFNFHLDEKEMREISEELALRRAQEIQV